MTDRRMRAGLVMGLSAYAIWGVVPVYFKLLASVDPTEIVAHRIVWALVLLAVVVSLIGRWRVIAAALAQPRTAATLVATTTSAPASRAARATGRRCDQKYQSSVTR